VPRSATFPGAATMTFWRRLAGSASWLSVNYAREAARITTRRRRWSGLRLPERGVDLSWRYHDAPLANYLAGKGYWREGAEKLNPETSMRALPGAPITTRA
jgi:hypothetical protein